MDGVWDMVEAERRDLAALVGGLSGPQLDSPSLCAAWRVRDVVGHVIWVAESNVVDMVLPFLSAGLRPNVMLEREARGRSDGDATALATRLEGVAGSRRIAPGMKPVGYLADTVVHAQDIRRPLGLVRSIPQDVLKPVLDHYLGSNQFTGGRSRTRDLTITATDMVWSQGYGPEVRGPAEALLLASVGRADALDELAGDGLDTFAQRVRG